MSIVGYGCARFLDGDIVHADFAGEDHGLGFLLGFGQAAFYQGYVQTCARGFGFHATWQELRVARGILTQRPQRARRVGRSADELGAALDEVFGDFAETGGAVGVGRDFGNGFGG